MSDSHQPSAGRKREPVDGGGRRRGARGELAIVLHTHMPYVEGFGTWPFGEEWLWEALATCYLPLLELLEAGAPLTVSLTPVLCDQLEAPGVGERFARFVTDTRRYTHAEDASGLRAGGHDTLAREVERSWGDYERALASFERRGGEILSAFAPYAQWTSAATHAVLPLLASEAGLRLQVSSGVESHRARFGAGTWRGGFWLPECAHSGDLEPALADAGVHAVCVELTNRFGLGAPTHLRPLVGESGVVLVPIDRATIARVWSDEGYPAHGRYRDYHHHTIHHHNPWANDGDAYDHEHALDLARTHAKDFVAGVRERLERDGRDLPGGGLVVCALDTELLGHWWYEGLAWLGAVVEECTRQNLPLVRLDDALERHEPAPLKNISRVREGGGAPVGSRVWEGGGAPVGSSVREGGGAPMDSSVREGGGAPVAGEGEGASFAGDRLARAGSAPPTDMSISDGQRWEVSTWGAGGDLSTWSGPAVAEIAFATRAAELEVMRAGHRAGVAAVRELLALQASDWAFMVARGLAVPYARERFETHRQGVERALAAGVTADPGALRNLAAHAATRTLLAA